MNESKADVVKKTENMKRKSSATLNKPAFATTESMLFSTSIVEEETPIVKKGRSDKKVQVQKTWWEEVSFLIYYYSYYIEWLVLIPCFRSLCGIISFPFC